jgi:CheY-like chemotaxis protein
MKRVLFLDDNEDRHVEFCERMQDHDVSVAFTTHQAIELLDTNAPYDVVYLDHDLGEIANTEPFNERTGRVVAEHIASVLPRDKWPKQVIIHSWNIDGSRRMRDILQNAGLAVSLAPF